MGSCKGEACEECTQKCLLIHHGRKDPSPIVTSFFKIMIGDRFSSVLFMPPKFARTIASLVDQVTYLEDLKGQRWRVTLSIVDGSLAIQQGWHEFASDHSLEIGDFVVFNYIAGSHFVVQMYSKSGCEKVTFPEKRNNSRGKRTRAKHSSGQLPSDGRNSSASKAPSEMTDKGSVYEQGSTSTIHSTFDVEILESKSDAKDVAKATEMTSNCRNSKRTSEPVKQVDYTEVPFYMIDSNLLDKQGASRSSLFDLSNFEMLNRKSSADGTEKKVPEVIRKEKSPHSDVKPVQPETTLENNCLEEQCHIIDEDPVGKDGKNSGVHIDVSDFEVHDDVADYEMPERDYNADTADQVPLAIDEVSCFSDISKQPPVMSTVDCSVNEMENLEISNGALKEPPFTKELNWIDPVVLQREHTPHESSGRVPQIISFTSGCSKNTVTMQAKDKKAGKVPEVVEKVHEMKVKEKHGEDPLIVKVEPEEKFDFSLGVDTKPFKVVKTESIDLPSLSSPTSVDFFCSAPAETQSFLELPVDLPAFACKGRRTNTERKIVLLRDSAMRKWPVIYHERSGFRVLASGWEALAKANNIQTGDICTLRVENMSESLLQLCIHRE